MKMNARVLKLVLIPLIRWLLPHRARSAGRATRPYIERALKWLTLQGLGAAQLVQTGGLPRMSGDAVSFTGEIDVPPRSTRSRRTWKRRSPPLSRTWHQGWSRPSPAWARCPGQILLSWSHVGRIATEQAFAMLSGTAPVPVSSGRTGRHRLNRPGDQQLNRALP